MSVRSEAKITKIYYWTNYFNKKFATNQEKLTTYNFKFQKIPYIPT